MHGVYFISGIDTDIGKTMATGYIAKQLLSQHISVISQKLIQTGCTAFSDDILKHRQIMQCELLAEDKQGLTAPQIFHYPASPHLAGQLEQKSIDFEKIKNATQQLSRRYDVVLLEGAGGLLVPLTSDFLTIDYIRQQHYPVILVTSGRLGSINHTLLSLLALKQYHITLYALAFNHFHDHHDPIIARDNEQFLQQYLAQHFPQAKWIDIPVLPQSS